MIHTIGELECEECGNMLAGPAGNTTFEMRVTGPPDSGTDNELSREIYEEIQDTPESELEERDRELKGLDFEAAKERHAEWEREKLETLRAEWRTEVEAGRHDIGERNKSVGEPTERETTDDDGNPIPVIEYEVTRHEAEVDEDTGEVRCGNCGTVLVAFDREATSPDDDAPTIGGDA